MAGEALILGNVVIQSIYDTGNTAWEPIGCLTSNTSSESLEVNEVETKCDPGNIVKTPGTYSYEKSGEGRYIDEAVDTGRQSYAKLKGYLRGKTLIEWRESTGLTSPTNEYGSGYVTDVEMVAESGQEVTFSYTISGTGAISSTDPHP